MKPVWEEQTFKDEEIIVKNVDIRDFYIDNTVKDSIDDADDCILIEWMSYEKFKTLKNNPFYQNIDKVAPRSWSMEDKPFTTTEEEVKQGEYVKFIKYYSVEKDAFMIDANGVLVENIHYLLQ